MRPSALPILLAALLAFAPAAGAGDGKRDLDAVVKGLASFMRKRELGKRDPAEIAKRIDGIPEDDLSWVLDRLREVPEKDRGGSAPAVEGAVENALLTLRYGAAVLQVPDAFRRFADPSDPARCALLADLSRLEDAEPATRFGLWALRGSTLAVRLRAVDTLADVASWGGDAARILPALEKSLDDPSPAVRDLALERLENLSDPAALEWSLRHMGEPAAEEAVVRDAREARCPGDRALGIATRASRLHFGMDPETLRGMAADDRRALDAEFAAWREKAGANPLRDGADGPFDPLPKVVSTVVGAKGDASASLRWWSPVDRAQFRLDLESIEVAAITKIDWVCNFRLTVGASGARQGDWEAYARRVRCGERHRLPRRGFGLVETSIQPLLDGRWRIWVRAYDWRGG